MKNKTFVLMHDSFKESMTAKEVCNAMEKWLRKVFSEAYFVHVPMADGSEGTTQSLIDATEGSLYDINANGPLGELVEASFGIMGDGEIAVIEIAAASGIQFINRDTKNPFFTTIYGTGELIRACLDKGIKNHSRYWRQRDPRRRGVYD